MKTKNNREGLILMYATFKNGYTGPLARSPEGHHRAKGESTDG
jgi:hypothetical protein